MSILIYKKGPHRPTHTQTHFIALLLHFFRHTRIHALIARELIYDHRRKCGCHILALSPRNTVSFLSRAFSLAYIYIYVYLSYICRCVSFAFARRSSIYIDNPLVSVCVASDLLTGHRFGRGENTHVLYSVLWCCIRICVFVYLRSYVRTTVCK